MCFPELAAVAFIENKYNSFVTKCFHALLKMLFTDSGIKFLNGGNNQFCIIGELPDQLCCVISAVNAAFAETIKFFGSLVIQILAVDYKNHLLNFG